MVNIFESTEYPLASITLILILCIPEEGALFGSNSIIPTVLLLLEITPNVLTVAQLALEEKVKTSL